MHLHRRKSRDWNPWNHVLKALKWFSFQKSTHFIILVVTSQVTQFQWSLWMEVEKRTEFLKNLQHVRSYQLFQFTRLYKYKDFSQFKDVPGKWLWDEKCEVIKIFFSHNLDDKIENLTQKLSFLFYFNIFFWHEKSFRMQNSLETGDPTGWRVWKMAMKDMSKGKWKHPSQYRSS